MDCFPTEEEFAQRNEKDESYCHIPLLKEFIKTELIKLIWNEKDFSINSFTVLLNLCPKYIACLEWYKDEFPTYNIIISTEIKKTVSFSIENGKIEKYNLLRGLDDFGEIIKFIQEKRYLKICSDALKSQLKKYMKTERDTKDIYMSFGNVYPKLSKNIIIILELFWKFIFEEIKQEVKKNNRVSYIDEYGLGINITFDFSNRHLNK